MATVGSTSYARHVRDRRSIATRLFHRSASPPFDLASPLRDSTSSALSDYGQIVERCTTAFTLTVITETHRLHLMTICMASDCLVVCLRSIPLSEIRSAPASRCLTTSPEPHPPASFWCPASSVSFERSLAQMMHPTSTGRTGRTSTGSTHTACSCVWSGTGRVVCWWGGRDTR